MPLEHRDLKYIWDTLDAPKTVVELTEGRTLDEYERTKWLRLAVERSIEIIGEAARRVFDDGRAAYPEVPWGVIVATRHIMAHEYGDLQHDKVLRIAKKHVPALIAQLQPIIDAHPIDDLPGSNS